MYCFAAATCLLPSYFRKESASTTYRTRSKAWKGLVIKLIQSAIRFIASKQPGTVTFESRRLFSYTETALLFSSFLDSSGTPLQNAVTVTPRNRCAILVVCVRWSKMEPWEWKSSSFSEVWRCRPRKRRSNSGDEQLLRISLGKIVARHKRLRAYQPVLNRRVETRAFSKYYRKVTCIDPYSAFVIFRQETRSNSRQGRQMKLFR